MKTKIAIDLPDIEKLTAGLDLRTVHPPLRKAEDAAETAQSQLNDSLSRLDEVARRLETPGQLSEKDIFDAAARKPALEALVQRYGQQLEEARGTVEAERKRARAAVEAEAKRRLGGLQTEADKLASVLDELRRLDAELGRAHGDAIGEPSYGYPYGVDWRSPPQVDVALSRGDITGERTRTAWSQGGSA